MMASPVNIISKPNVSDMNNFSSHRSSNESFLGLQDTAASLRRIPEPLQECDRRDEHSPRELLLH